MIKHSKTINILQEVVIDFTSINDAEKIIKKNLSVQFTTSLALIIKEICDIAAHYLCPLTSISEKYFQVMHSKLRTIITTSLRLINELPKVYFHAICTVEKFTAIINKLYTIQDDIVKESNTFSHVLSSITDQLYSVSHELHKVLQDFESDL